jgi:hypothetical protein
MLEIVHNRVTRGVTTVVEMAAVLRCWKANGTTGTGLVLQDGLSLSENRDLIVTAAENGQLIHVFILIPMKWEEYRMATIIRQDALTISTLLHFECAYGLL